MPTIKLPPTPLLALQGNWGVVNTLRLRLRKGPSIHDPALITLWKGYVVQVQRRSSKEETINGLSHYWYYITYKGLPGWVYGEYLTMYDSQQRAEQASKELTR